MRNTRKAEDSLKILVDLTRTLSESEIGLEQALELVTQAALTLFQGDHASVRVLDESGAHLLSGARSGNRDHSLAMRVERREGVAGWVLTHGEVARVADVATDPRFTRFEGHRFVQGSMLCVPLYAAGSVIGCLAITSTEVNHFSLEDEYLARLLANCAVPPLERTRLQRIAEVDDLTGALRQSQLLGAIRRAQADSRIHHSKTSVIAFDLDHFRLVNELFGHPGGDEVLRVFAERLRGEVRVEDIVVRRGGEEFVVVLPGCDEDAAVNVAERVRQTLAQKRICFPDGRCHYQTVSAGVARWDGVESAEALEARADEALYEAKHSGRDCVRRSDLGSGDALDVVTA